MITRDSLTHFSCSFKFSTSNMVNILDALDDIPRGDYRLNNCY